MFAESIVMIDFQLSLQLKANITDGEFGSPAASPTSGNYFNEIYIKPWARAGPFFAGILTAYIVKVYRTNHR